MKDMNIIGNAIENLLLEYAEHKAKVKLLMEEASFDVDKLERDSDFMYQKGFCDSTEKWIRCIGMSLESPKIEQMIRDCMLIEKR